MIAIYRFITILALFGLQTYAIAVLSNVEAAKIAYIFSLEKLIALFAGFDSQAIVNRRIILRQSNFHESKHYVTMNIIGFFLIFLLLPLLLSSDFNMITIFIIITSNIFMHWVLELSRRYQALSSNYDFNLTIFCKNIFTLISLLVMLAFESVESYLYSNLVGFFILIYALRGNFAKAFSDECKFIRNFEFKFNGDLYKFTFVCFMTGLLSVVFSFTERFVLLRGEFNFAQSYILIVSVCSGVLLLLDVFVISKNYSALIESLGRGKSDILKYVLKICIPIVPAYTIILILFTNVALPYMPKSIHSAYGFMDLILFLVINLFLLLVLLNTLASHALHAIYKDSINAYVNFGMLLFYIVLSGFLTAIDHFFIAGMIIYFGSCIIKWLKFIQLSS